MIFVVQFQYGFSFLSVALALTVFNLPQMTRTVEDSLRTVHHTQREAGLALGLSRWETICYVVVPEALPGIVTGIVLASGRILGKQQHLFTQLVNQHRPLTGVTGIHFLFLVRFQSSAKLRRLLFTSGKSIQKGRHQTPQPYQLVQQQYS